MPHVRKLPDCPGKYRWSTWGEVVDVYCKGGKFVPGKSKLYVCPPGGSEIQVGPRIAGQFKKVEEAVVT